MAARYGTAFIDFEGKFDKLHRQVRQAVGPLSKEMGEGVGRGFERELRVADRALVRTRGRSEGLSNSVLRLKLVAGALSLGPAVSGLNAFSAGAVAAAGSLGPLIGSLAAIPSLATAAGQALATVKLGTSGIGDALKAANDQIVQGGGAATAALERQRGAAERVRSAKLALTAAQRQATMAQRDLTDARREGRRELEDMRLAAERSRDSERGAVLALKRARQELARVEIDPQARGLDVADARQRVSEAENDLEQTRLQARRERKDFADARKRGVDGLPRVTSARQQLAESNRQVAEASRQVAVAQREATAAMGKQSAAASKYQQALAQLSPEAQHFVETLMSYRPVLKELQAASGEGLLPGAEKGLAAASKNAGVLRRVLKLTGGELGGVAERVGEFFGRRDVGRDIEIQGERNAVTIRRFGDSSLHLADALRHVTIEAGPLVDWLTRSALGWARNTAETAKARRESGELAEGFERTRFILTRLFSITGHLTSGLRGVFRAGREDGDKLWMSVDRLANRFDTWANSLHGQKALRDWFAEGRETLGDVADGIRELRRRFRELRGEGRSSFDAMAITLSEAIAKAIGHAVEAVAQRAPAIAEAFIKGFLAADGWGKLAIGGWLLHKFGGMGAVKALGKQIAGGLSGGLTGALPRGVSKKTPIPVWVVNQGPGGGGKGGPKVPPVVTNAPKLAPLALAGRLIPVIGATGLIYYIASKNAKNDFPTRGVEAARRRAETPSGTGRSFSHERVADPFRGKDESAAAAAAGADQLAKRVKAVRAEIRKMRDGSVGDVRDINKAATSNFKQIRDSIGLHTKEGRQAAAENFKGAAKAIAESVKDGRTSTSGGMKAIRDLLDDRSLSGRKALEGNFDDVIAVIARTMRRGGKITDEGLALIRKAYVEQLRFYGFSPKQAVNEAKPGTRFDSGPEEGSRGPVRRARGGGIPVPGTGSGDKVPLTVGGRLAAMVEPRERLFVLNRNATSKLDQLQTLNRAAPRFREGGILELLHPFNDPAGHGGRNSHLHIAMRSIQALIALGRRLQGQGWLVGEHPAFGGIQGGHDPQGYHYTNQAIDVNWPDPAKEGGKIRALLSSLGDFASGAAAEKLRRIVISGADSPLRSVVQGAMDVAVGAAQSRLDSLAGMSVEGAEDAGTATGNGAELMRQIAAQRGWNFADWWELDRRETSHGQNLTNPTSTARLRGQFLDMNWGKYGPGSDPRQNPTMAQQIVSMADYIAERYGNATRARQHHDSHNWYQRGGIVQMLQAGGVLGLQGGGLLRTSFGNTLKRLRSKKPKVRRRALTPLLEKVKAAGVPAHVQTGLEQLSKDSEVYGDMASRASSLTDIDGITQALEAEMGRRKAAGQPFPDSDQQTMVESMLARVGGLTESQWLNKQLEALFGWRNRIVEAERIVVERRDEITSLIEHAKERLARVTKLIRETAKTRTRLYKRLTAERKKRRPNRSRVRRLRERVMGLDALQRHRGREQGAIREQILPALTEKREALNTTRGDLLSNLEGVQGAGSPTEILGELPPIGVMGGQILDVQLRLRDLVRSSPRVTDAAAGEAAAPDDNGLADLLRQQLQEANQRTAVSEAQFGVLKDFPRFGGVFHGGGVVPGPSGEERLILAKAGETVIPEGAGQPAVRIVIEDNRVRVFVDDVEQIVEKVTRRQARQAGRGLPGRAGARG